MSNITKCIGTDCPLKETCKRYLATINGSGESVSYFSSPPYEHNNGRCFSYVKAESEKTELKK
jgi:hypothetical protein